MDRTVALEAYLNGLKGRLFVLKQTQYPSVDWLDLAFAVEIRCLPLM